VIRAAAAALVLALAACSSAPAPVPLTPEFPASVGTYEDVTWAWTRRAVLRGDYQQALEVHATFRSPMWHAAYAALQVQHRHLAGAAANQVFGEARAASEGDYQIALAVVTYDPRENDLDRGPRSIWRLALVDDAGRETAPIEIVRDRRPLEVLRAELPEVTEFAKVYIATFPRSANVLRPDARAVTLKMWSSRGGVALVWKAP